MLWITLVSETGRIGSRPPNWEPPPCLFLVPPPRVSVSKSSASGPAGFPPFAANASRSARSSNVFTRLNSTLTVPV